MADTVGLTAKLSFQGDAAIDGMRQASGAFASMREQAQKLKAGAAEVKQGLAGLKIGGIVAALGIGASVKKFAEFDEVMADMRATLGAEYGKEFPALENAARDMAGKTGKSVITVGDAMRSLAREGQKPAEILQSLPAVLNTMTATGLDAASTARVLDQTIDRFGLTAKDAGGALDAMVLGARKSGAPLAEFAAGVNSLAGTATLLKVDVKDTAAAVAMFVEGGMDATTAATNLNMGLLKLARASKSGWINVAGLGRIQVKTKDGALDLATTMMNVGNALSDVKDPAQRVNLAMSLFGMRGRESASALEKLTKDPKALPKMFETIRNQSDGAAAAMAKMKTDTLSGKLKKLKMSLTNVSVEIGSAFLPFMESAVKTVIPVAQGFAKAFRFFVGTPEAIDRVGVSLAGVNPMVVQVTQGLVSGFSGVRTVTGWVIDAIKTIGGMFGVGGEGVGGAKFAVEWAVKIGAVVGAYKLLAPVIRNVALVGTGSAKMIQGALGMLGSGASGLIGVVGKRFPAIARILPKAGGALGKAISAAEKITAQPVRIVNWDEAGGLPGAPGGPKLPSGTRELDLAGTGAPGGPGRAGWRTRASAVAGGGLIGTLTGLAGGVMANTLIQGEGRAGVRALANGALALGAAFGPAGLAVAGVGAGFLALGSKLDELTGASDWLSDKMAGGKAEERVAAYRASGEFAQYKSNLDLAAMRETATTLAGFAAAGKTVNVGAGRETVTTDLIQRRLEAYAAKAASPEDAKRMIALVMQEVAPRIAEAVAKNVNLETTLVLDGRAIAKGAATATQETRSRRGVKEKPGDRTRAAS